MEDHYEIPEKFEHFLYIGQLLQAEGIRIAIEAHRQAMPYNMGSLYWQLNDCWPVASWSITDYSRQPKGAWSGVRQAYTDDVLPRKDSIRPKYLPLKKPEITWRWKNDHTLVLKSKAFAKYVYLHADDVLPEFSDNYFDLQPGIEKIILLKKPYKGLADTLKVMSLYDVMQ